MEYAGSIEEMKSVLKKVYGNVDVDELSDQMVEHYYNIFYYGD